MTAPPPASPGLSGRRVGVIGLGLMGRPVACNLLHAGARVTVHNRSRAAVDALVADGAEGASTPAEVVCRSDDVILMLTDTPAVEAVLYGPDGVVAALENRHLLIDMGTTAPTETGRHAGDATGRGALWLDAPVSGGEIGARDGTLSIMCGGTEAAFARARPILDVLGQRVTLVGGAGAGQVAKAANQVIVGLNIGAVAEALALAEAAGVDPARVREALQGGFADSRVLAVHGQRMIERDFAPGGRASTQLKDMEQALALAASLGVDLPATALSRNLYRQLAERGLGALDQSGLFRLWAPEE